MKLQYIIHFYIGQECEAHDGIRGLLMAYDSLETLCQLDLGGMGPSYHPYDVSDIKPLLRPLSDMTLIEKAEYETLFGHNPNERDEWYTTLLIMDIGKPEAWAWLLSRGFDLFGLIDAGLAIDKTKQL